MKILLSFIFVFTFSASCQNPVNTTYAEQEIADQEFTNYNIPLKKLVDSLKLNNRKAKILVFKSKYLLKIVFEDTTIVKCYPVVFGFNPIDDKLREGDGCTPEGNFKIISMYPHKSWSKFIWFDYPNDHSKIKHNSAKTKGLIPKDSRIGGEVGIHGVPSGADFAIDKRQNWTLGCVSLKNSDIDEIYNFVFVGMPVEIQK